MRVTLCRMLDIVLPRVHSTVTPLYNRLKGFLFKWKSLSKCPMQLRWSIAWRPSDTCTTTDGQNLEAVDLVLCIEYLSGCIFYQLCHLPNRSLLYRGFTFVSTTSKELDNSLNHNRLSWKYRGFVSLWWQIGWCITVEYMGELQP